MVTLDNARDALDDAKESAGEKLRDELKIISNDSKLNLETSDINYKERILDSHDVDVPVSDESGLFGVGEFSVGGESAPHAPITEFGTGVFNESSSSPLNSDEFTFGTHNRENPPPYDNLAEWTREEANVPDSEIYPFVKFLQDKFIELGVEAHPYFRPAYFSRKNRAIKNIGKAFKDEF